MSSVDRLWVAAQRLPWYRRPEKSDIATVAPAVQYTDGIVAVHRVAWSLTAAGALVVTSRSVLVGDRNASSTWKSAVAAAPGVFRLDSAALDIPRSSIRRIDLEDEGIRIVTTAGSVVLPVPAGNRHDELAACLHSISPRPAAPVVPVVTAPEDEQEEVVEFMPYPSLWSGRERIDGRIVITRARADDDGAGTDWVSAAGRAWRRLPRWVQWVVSLGLFVAIQSVAAPGGVAFAVLMVLFLAWTYPEKSAERRLAARQRLRAGSPEAELAASGSIEARVAAAAYRAWTETVHEPSWSSAALAGTRASFDGQHEVDTILDLALRIHSARIELGPTPGGSLVEYWRQQMNALDRAALRLGDRADALIRHRDQAAELSAELAQLAELERLERSALVIDDLTVATSSMPAGHGQSPASEQITAVRQTVGELIELMTRTRAPLAEPVQSPTENGA